MEIYQENPKNIPSPWLAARASGIIPSTPGLKAFINDLSLALTIKLNENVVKKIEEYNKLSLEDINLLIPQTGFNYPTIWAEWNNETDFIEIVNPKNKRENFDNPTIAQVGVLIKSSSDGRIGYASYIIAADDVFIVPFGMTFNWKNNYKLQENIMEELRINLLNNENPPTEDGESITGEKLDILIRVNSRFGMEPSMYVKIPEEAMELMAPILNASAQFVLKHNLFLVGLANVLECCEVKDWREARLLVQ